MPKKRAAKPGLDAQKPLSQGLLMPQSCLLSEVEIENFHSGKNPRLYNCLGAHWVQLKGVSGTQFSVWAPHAMAASVVGDFNGWDRKANPLKRHAGSGVWESYVSGVVKGEKYKFHLLTNRGEWVEKADPMAFYAETPPKNASVVWDLDYEWHDSVWMKSRGSLRGLHSPMSIYELHLGSWRRNKDGSFLNYREIAVELADYVKDMGFTHVELMPVMEHPFYGSWGYQITGYFAPTSRYGTPQDFMFFVDHLHQKGIGVVLDWVASHFPTDSHGLGNFDGTHLFEHWDFRRGYQPDWSSYVFDYGRSEIRSFLTSNAVFWFEKYHMDGLRVDAVASMLYLDYSRGEGQWVRNRYGGRENVEAITFIRSLNEDIYREFPDVHTFAEESTAWSMVSRPTYIGGLGFGMKWDMGWMHDTLAYLSKDPLHRKDHHNLLSFRMLYAFNENFVLSLSHDEVVYGKRSLLEKMSGSRTEQFANLRLLLGYMFAQPGKKLLFMGGEFGQVCEWYHEKSLDWKLLGKRPHRSIRAWVKALNRFYAEEQALHVFDFSPQGFEWIDCHDSSNSVISFLRKGKKPGETVLAIANFTPKVHRRYRIGVPTDGRWVEVLNSDSAQFGGKGTKTVKNPKAERIPWHGRNYSLSLTLPPLSIFFLKQEGTGRVKSIKRK